MFAAVDDIARQFPQAKGEFVAEIEKGSEKNDETAEEEKRATEFTKRVHRVILPEGASKSACDP